MFGFTRIQLLLLLCAGLAVAISSSMYYAGARLAPPLTLVEGGRRAELRPSGAEPRPSGAEPRPSGAELDLPGAELRPPSIGWSSVALAAEAAVGDMQSSLGDMQRSGGDVQLSVGEIQPASGSEIQPSGADGQRSGGDVQSAHGECDRDAGAPGAPGAPDGAQPGAISAGPARDLNRMTLDDLVSLPGIGPVLAQRILDYREERGGFDSLDQLLEIKGIGQAKFGQLLALVTLGPPSGPPSQRPSVQGAGCPHESEP